MTDGPVDRPPAYPPHWEADVVAADGGTVHLRPILPTDGPALSALVERSSERTRYLRFFGPYPRIPERDLYRFVNVDHHDRVAFVLLLGHDIVAVGRYERLGPDESSEPDTAEVAFLVEDAHQGRGLGSILLEHLAAAGRESGIRRFSAEVLAENGGMVRIFLHAGYTATRSYSDGVVHLEFPIDATASSLAVLYEREQRAESRSIARLLRPRSVAVIGAGHDRGQLGYAVLRNLLDYGFQGPLYPVHPDAPHAAGVPAYPTILDVPAEVDLAVFAVPPTEIADVVEQCRAKGVHGLVVLTGGSGEHAAGQLVAAARAQGMRVIGPHSLGIVNTDPQLRLNASLASEIPPRGRVGFFCQSGALGITMLATAVQRGLGLSTFVSAGHRADVSGNDLLQFWATDPATEVVALYLESFGNPRKFIRLARGLARTKPVVAVTSGRYAAATVPGLDVYPAELPQHTVQALFEAAGMIRVDTVTQLFDVALLLAGQQLPTGRRVGIVGNSSALGRLVADACLAHGLDIAGPPVDVGAGAPAPDFAAAVQQLGGAGAADAVIVVFVPPLVTRAADVARAVAAATAGWSVPVVTTFPGAEGSPVADEVWRGSLPSYPSPERAVLALARTVRYAEWRARPAGAVPDLSDVDSESAERVVRRVLLQARGGRDLTGQEATELLAAYGIDLLTERTAASRDDAVAAAAVVGYPVVLKAGERQLRHRADLSGVRLDLPDATALAAAYDSMPGDGTVVVQPMAPVGVATTLAVQDDPSFGALVTFGVAGVASELLGDVAYRATPLSDADAADLVRSVRAWPLLAGYRGAAPVDVAALEDLVLRLGRLAEDLPEVLRLDLEPVIVGERGLTVAGAHVRVGPATARAPAGPRRLSTPSEAWTGQSR